MFVPLTFYNWFHVQWWERRKRAATRWTCGREITRSTGKEVWPTAWSAWDSWRHQEPAMLKRSFKHLKIHAMPICQDVLHLRDRQINTEPLGPSAPNKENADYIFAVLLPALSSWPFVRTGWVTPRRRKRKPLALLMSSWTRAFEWKAIMLNLKLHSYKFCIFIESTLTRSITRFLFFFPVQRMFNMSKFSNLGAKILVCQIRFFFPERYIVLCFCKL